MNTDTGDVRHMEEFAKLIGKTVPENKLMEIDPRNLSPQKRAELEATGHTKVGRNDPCPCGSGKKFKKCCLGKEVAK